MCKPTIQSNVVGTHQTRSNVHRATKIQLKCACPPFNPMCMRPNKFNLMCGDLPNLIQCSWAHQIQSNMHGDLPKFNLIYLAPTKVNKKLFYIVKLNLNKIKFKLLYFMFLNISILYRKINFAFAFSLLLPSIRY